MSMRVLVLGATGYIGQRIVANLRACDWATPFSGSRRPQSPTSGADQRQVDTLDLNSLKSALSGMDAVVNCVAGSAGAIAEGARLLVEAALLQTGLPRIVHMSSMAAYGAQEGVLTESSALDPTLGWYAKAKCEAEAYMRRYAEAGHPLVMFRPGCVYGPGSEMWVGRIGRLLRSGRLGDLGLAGDGWSNLIHVEDVCAAVLASLRMPLDGTVPAIFNLAAPDSPRWNQYFMDLAVAIGATPVGRLPFRRVQLDAWIGGPPIKVAEIIAGRFGISRAKIPVPISRSLLKLWPQQIRLDTSKAIAALSLTMRSYTIGNRESAQWFLRSYAD